MKREKLVIFILTCIISAIMLFLLIQLCGGMSEERWIRI
ncbi:unknown [Prevotella sp. CAG:755]|nr:unknown [Prevotella sp. CAG:755]